KSDLASHVLPDLVNVFEVFLPQLLLYPNPSDPLNGEAAALMMRDRTAYDQRVKELIIALKFRYHKGFILSNLINLFVNELVLAKPKLAALAFILKMGLVGGISNLPSLTFKPLTN
ncbi:hypothetical protein HYC85_016459, partial [Camellia sinensis]